MTKLNNEEETDYQIIDGRNHILFFTDDKLKLRSIDIDVQPIIDAIETTIYNMLDAKQLKYNVTEDFSLDIEYIEKIIGIAVEGLYDSKGKLKE
tara:strand:+ start:121 stop:402 length:282 start_codon:yes stop_codon:yes gene_type:complete